MLQFAVAPVAVLTAEWPLQIFEIGSDDKPSGQAFGAGRPVGSLKGGQPIDVSAGEMMQQRLTHHAGGAAGGTATAEGRQTAAERTELHPIADDRLQDAPFGPLPQDFVGKSQDERLALGAIGRCEVLVAQQLMGVAAEPTPDVQLARSVSPGVADFNTHAARRSLGDLKHHDQPAGAQVFRRAQQQADSFSAEVHRHAGRSMIPVGRAVRLHRDRQHGDLHRPARHGPALLRIACFPGGWQGMMIAVGHLQSIGRQIVVDLIDNSQGLAHRPPPRQKLGTLAGSRTTPPTRSPRECCSSSPGSRWAGSSFCPSA